ncbi:pentatricopeptide repeat-containing protein At5g67570, chloroplastic-like isoform X2 [Hordeum vulgare subsp. vulgare]|uniref:pentatricopeptide repeat-containing protein At5g67570, chloroplastic-like isoform X2 n=1 Tax=Hordeum vulgare subsp. vulgare TaxID=112509 RepID=UPI001D1A5B25|nr:pentatricopeptide repeat-containing protein At5g67570, chloroplastic-like isoform X2 [Hordeum vulgare subsp. vulgare]XP_044962165.1 pentatricopeptide repeat-containing protein At5g67570, chloroplastic-like isoform X2 [Hordeum vulgare subsp. vulgare]XP_044962166.1 pentatricopeptide repeat-containing protein At5g67570, chloroplastic-like isoform X2 [Hordeum vulgare subsp. vulgare]
MNPPAAALPPTNEPLRRRLLRKDVSATPKILHALRKKEAGKSLRRARKEAATATATAPPKEDALVAEEEARFRAAAEEYRVLMGRPWHGARGIVGPLRAVSGEDGLVGLRKMLEERSGDRFQWLLDGDVENEGVEDARGRGEED